MRKIILIGVVSALGLMVLASFESLRHGKKDGTEPGFTGSPGDSLKNCTVCHGGIATTQEGWITSNIPNEGYTPGASYIITATNTKLGDTRFGFSVSPQNIAGDLLGTMVVTDTLRTKLVGNNKYITYREAGVEGMNALAWSFKWIAPAEGTGNVTFYGAFNSNHEGHKGGDHTTLSTLTVREKWKTGLAKTFAQRSGFSVYPNPAQVFTVVTFNANFSGNALVDVVDMQGKQYTHVIVTQQSGLVRQQINTENLPAGNYLVRLMADGETAVQRLVVAH
jgi:hypothetical protein